MMFFMTILLFAMDSRVSGVSTAVVYLKDGMVIIVAELVYLTVFAKLLPKCFDFEIGEDARIMTLNRGKRCIDRELSKTHSRSDEYILVR